MSIGGRQVRRQEIVDMSMSPVSWLLADYSPHFLVFHSALLVFRYPLVCLALA